MIKTVVNVLKNQQNPTGKSVLDAGCGTGNYAIALAEEGFHVTGVDFSPGMLECARSKVTQAHAERLLFEKLDMNDRLTFPDVHFDHVISMSSLWTVADPNFTLNEFCRVMKPGGTLIVMQVPKPTVSLKNTIRARIKYLERKSPTVIALVVFKAVLERSNSTKYWSPEELLALLLSNGQLDISYVDHGPPIVIVATKR